MRTPRFEIFEGKNNEFFFRLKAKNGKIILQSEGYTQKHSCLDGAEAVQYLVQHGDNIFHTKWSWEILPNGKKRINKWFVFKAANGEIIGTSEMYRSKRGCLAGIESCRRCAPIAEIVDLSKD